MGSFQAKRFGPEDAIVQSFEQKVILVWVTTLPEACKNLKRAPSLYRSSDQIVFALESSYEVQSILWMARPC